MQRIPNGHCPFGILFLYKSNEISLCFFTKFSLDNLVEMLYNVSL